MRLIYRSVGEKPEVIPGSLDRKIAVLPQDQSKRKPLLRVDLLDSYKEFFKFKESPFPVSPNPKFFYFSRSHAEALNHLRYGIYEGLGFSMIIGEPGTGKTMLSRYFLSKAGEDLRIVHIPDPRLSPIELLVTVLENLGVSRISPEDLTERKLTEQTYDLLLLAHRQSKKIAIFIDEAQGLDFEPLERLRLLSNLETDSQKLLQIVLFGQTELEEKLMEKDLRQLDQRILVRYHLLPLQLDEMQLYIQHQLTVAKVDSAVEFVPQAVSKIYEISGGLPRMVNVLCERALMSAFTENSKKINVQNVLEAWESLNGIRILERVRL
ncbi:MAG: AAA family ATPase [Candidatus Zixiibacteriota bacterium]